jgi:hypothetical protein
MTQERHTRRNRPFCQHHQAQCSPLGGRSAKASTGVGSEAACEAGASRRQRGLTLLALTVSLVLCACSSTRTGSRARTSNESMSLSGAEWSSLAEGLVEQLGVSGVLARYQKTQEGRVCLAIGDVGFSHYRDPDARIQFSTSFMPTFKSMMTQGHGGCPVSFNMDVVGTAAAGLGSSGPTEDLISSSSYDQSSTTWPGQAVAPALVVSFLVDVQEHDEGRTTSADTTVSMSLSDLRTRETVLVLTGTLPKTFTSGLFGSD